MKVRMWPHLDELGGRSSGIAQVVKYLFRHLPAHGIDLVSPQATSYDLEVGHAAARPRAQVHHSHGLLWTEEFELGDSSWQTNAHLVEAIRSAYRVTTPSRWVAETFARDMHFMPDIIPWGVEWEAWQHDRENLGYVLWGKNRTSDGLDPRAIIDIALAYPNVEFVTTFAPVNHPPNVKVLGAAVPFKEMKLLIQQAAVVLATDKETFGIMPLEAMAAGVPVLTINTGAVPSFCPSGISGYAFEPGDLEDAKHGLNYCLTHRDVLGENGRELARDYRWEDTAEKIARVYEEALDESREKATVDVIIPCHNYGKQVGRAIGSALEQTYPVARVIVVDDGSTDDTKSVVREWAGRDQRVEYRRVSYGNVAQARNEGYRQSSASYILPLDADDRIEPGFIERLLPTLEKDRGAGIAYTGVRVILPGGEEVIPWDADWRPKEGQVIMGRQWPHDLDYEAQMRRENQVPTCCLIRREALERCGGYRARYCPAGAGSEDAEMFLRIGADGWRMVYVPPKQDALFVHTTGQGNVSGNREYREPNWTAWHPWARDGRHPFASIAPAERYSHPVRYYDDPVVSVIIPVGPGHEEKVVDALDSLEAQTVRKWEVIVVYDVTKAVYQERMDKLDTLLDSYPYAIRVWVESGVAFTNDGRVLPHMNEMDNPEYTSGNLGAGAARNIGARFARAPVLAFLDADDYYHPDYLRKCLDTLVSSQDVVITNYVTRIKKKDHDYFGGKILDENERNDTLIVDGKFNPYDCERARQRPSGNRPYVWSGVTVMLPKKWHDDIGGFDEGMNSWEDCDYVLRLAWAGHCFTRIEDSLWMYDATTGGRRLSAVPQDLVPYLQEKYDELEAAGEIMPCNCGQPAPVQKLDDSDRLPAIYNSPNRGKHMVYGGTTHHKYGYLGGGQPIPGGAYKEDIFIHPHLYLCGNCRKPFDILTNGDVVCPRCLSLGNDGRRAEKPRDKAMVAEKERPGPPPDLSRGRELSIRREGFTGKTEETVSVLAAARGLASGPFEQIQNDPYEKMVIKEIDFGRSVNSRHKKILSEVHIRTMADVRELGREGLTAIKGIGDGVATALLEYKP